MNFASLLAQLLDKLRQLPPETPAHLQHLFIRVQRAKKQAEEGQGTEGLERLVRLRGRLEELEEGLNELASVEGDEGRRREWSELRNQVQQAREGLEAELRKATTTITSAISSTSSPSATSHSRSSSIDLPRRTPSTAPTTRASTANIESFLSRISKPSSKSQSSLSSLAQERAKSLSQAYSLFLLSTSPSSVLPPGQTLSSIFRNAASSSDPPSSRPTASSSLAQQLSTQLSKAYFDDLHSKLSNRTTFANAWKTICKDLSEACLPLIPSRSGQGSLKRQVEELLSAELTTEEQEEKEENLVSRKCVETIQTLLGVLRRLCAPARDGELAVILEKLDRGEKGNSKVLIEVVQGVLELAKNMKEDLEKFRKEVTVELAGEGDVLEAVKEEAAERERKVTREMVSLEAGSDIEDVDERIRDLTKKWARRRPRDGDTSDGTDLHVSREETVEALIDALFVDQAICVPPLPDTAENSHLSSPSSPTNPSNQKNSVPPIFYSTSPRLFEIQNQFQALTILSCLATILQPYLSSSDSPPKLDTLIARLWIILNSEIPSFSSSTLSSSETSSTPTRLVHLSEEIISHLDSTSIDDAGKEKIKSSVDRILRYQGPVFKLLQKRLSDGIRGVALRSLQRRKEMSSKEAVVPINLKTGRNLKGSSNSQKGLPSLYSRGTKPELEVLGVEGIKGYEKLGKEIEEVLRVKLLPVVEWVEEVWEDVLEWETM